LTNVVEFRRQLKAIQKNTVPDDTDSDYEPESDSDSGMSCAGVITGRIPHM